MIQEKYAPHDIEAKWQKYWEENKTFKVEMDKDKPKSYVLEMFPYPSGNLHMGHVRNYSIGDVIARFRTMKGFNVLHPMGWDSFGMPAENAAIKHNIPPKKWTLENIANMTRQLKALGLSYDWDREVTTCKEDYYKWTQWFFELFYKRGLAVKKESAVNWCDTCNTVLANEQVIDGKCWRCDHEVVKKDLSQWFFKITDYADELLKDLDLLPGWPERVKTMQHNWIGRSEGLEFSFEIPALNDTVAVYTTRPDTAYGVTFMALAAEHPLIKKICENNPKADEINAFCERVRNQSEIERTSSESEKEGVFTGVYCINPFTGRKVEIWVTNYVLYDYGTGAVMGVPTGDQRDWMFADKYGIEKIVTICPIGKELKLEEMTCAYEEKEGMLVNSGEFTGMEMHKAMSAIMDKAEAEGFGKRRVNYRLRDWLISRQRYWGAPIPIIYCPHCGEVLVPEDQLPVRLPEDVSFTAGAKSPLATSEEFVHCKCPKCGADATRETDTMDTFLCSSWYYLRYTDAHNDKMPFDKELNNYWGPVDQYIGGIEHAILHLLYSRFWHKFLYDIGVVHTKEPYAKRTSHGMILGQNPHYVGNVSTEEEKQALIEKYGSQALRPAGKMSKALGNVVNPDDVVKAYGADTMRLYIMFIGDFEKVATWSDDAVKGSKRFLDRCWNLMDMAGASEDLSEKNEAIIHKTIRKVTQDIDELKMNTAIAALMTMVNEFYANGLSEGDLEMLMLMLSPFAPHMVEEMWELTGFAAKTHKMAMQMPWPEFDESKTVASHVEMAVQVLGKLRGTIVVPVDSEQDFIVSEALKQEKVAKFVEGKNIVKVILVKNKLVNLIVK